MADLVVRAGGTLMFSENNEVRDAVDQLTCLPLAAAHRMGWRRCRW